MNYDNIILDLMNRICVLENKMKSLEKGNFSYKNNDAKKEGEDDNLIVENNQIVFSDDLLKPGERIQKVIEGYLSEAKSSGQEFLLVTSGRIEKICNLKNRMPSVCNAMRKVANECVLVKKYEVVRDTPSHNSSTYTIKYYL